MTKQAARVVYVRINGEPRSRRMTKSFMVSACGSEEEEEEDGEHVRRIR